MKITHEKMKLTKLILNQEIYRGQPSTAQVNPFTVQIKEMQSCSPKVSIFIWKNRAAKTERRGLKKKACIIVVRVVDGQSLWTTISFIFFIHRSITPHRRPDVWILAYGRLQAMLKFTIGQEVART